MRRTTTVLLAALVVVGMVGAVPMTGVAQQTTAEPTETETATDGGTSDANATAPGDLLEGVVGVQEAELEGEIENRAFGIQVAQAATENAKAEVVAERFQTIKERLNELEERKQELQEARASGNISTSEYRSEIATLAARTNNMKQLLNRSAKVSEGLPNETLQANGINVTAIRTLQERANQLTGPEVAEIARSIAGPSTAVEASDGASERRGPPEDGGASAGDRSGNRTAGGGQSTETPDRGGSGSGSDAGSGAGSGSGSGSGSGAGSGGSGAGSGGSGAGSGGSGAGGY